MPPKRKNNKKKKGARGHGATNRRQRQPSAQQSQARNAGATKEGGRWRSTSFGCYLEAAHIGIPAFIRSLQAKRCLIVHPIKAVLAKVFARGHGTLWKFQHHFWSIIRCSLASPWLHNPSSGLSIIMFVVNGRQISQKASSFIVSLERLSNQMQDVDISDHLQPNRLVQNNNIAQRQTTDWWWRFRNTSSGTFFFVSLRVCFQSFPFLKEVQSESHIILVDAPMPASSFSLNVSLVWHCVSVNLHLHWALQLD